jgi:uncharacterized RDD family membrane protein YckC
MSFPAGWYDDPQDPTQQRYWDGGFWTDYRRPREGPPPYQGQFGQPGQADQPAPGGPGEPGQQGFGPGLGQPGMGREGYGPQGPQGYGPQGFGYGPRVPATPDGQQLAGWWKRVAARIIDSIIVLVIGLPFTGYFYYRYIQAINDNNLFGTPASGETPSFGAALPLEIYQWIIPASVLGLLVELAYSYFFLTRTGATPGKKAMGLSVRLRDVPGPPPGSAVVKRWAIVSVFGFVCGCLSLLDVLFPLWDDKKQALHDKIADTNVVVGPQQRR